MMQKVTKAVIPAAGFGTRMLPATKAQPKEMLPVVNKPTIQYIIEELVASGITDILIIVWRSKEPIIDHFDHSYELEDTLEKKGKMQVLEDMQHIRKMANIYYIRQQQMLGTAHAIQQARAFVGDDPFVMAFGDDIVTNRFSDGEPVFRQWIQAHETHGASVVATREVSASDVSKYGIASTTDQLDAKTRRINGMIEKPSPDEAPSRLASLWGYLFKADIFDAIDRIEMSERGELELPTAVQLLMDEWHDFVAHNFEGQHYDIGNKLWFVTAQIALGLQDDEIGGQVRDFIRWLDM